MLDDGVPDMSGMDDLNACDRMVPLILRHADGTLAAPDRAALDAHAASCAACREAIADQSAAVRLLAELPMMQAPRDFAARVRARVAPAGGLLDLLDWRAWTLRLVPAAALLALLAWLPSRATTASSAIDAWASATADTNTAALLVSADTSGADLLAAAYEGYAR
jgi:anti-sigma factor RsiW